MIYSSFPRVPHLPGSSNAPEDLLLDDEGARPFLEERVTVYEKLDGINVALRRTGRTRIEAGLKPEWTGVLGGRVARAIDIWQRQRERSLQAALGAREVLYGEWLWHRVSVSYPSLPTLFVGFSWRGDDGELLGTRECRRRMIAAGLDPILPLFEGRLGSVAKLRSFVGRSRCGAERMEGVIVERGAGRYPRFAKWVEPDYAHPTAGRLSGARNQLVVP